jgi:hypothetical protein
MGKAMKNSGGLSFTLLGWIVLIGGVLLESVLIIAFLGQSDILYLIAASVGPVAIVFLSLNWRRKSVKWLIGIATGALLILACGIVLQFYEPQALAPPRLHMTNYSMTAELQPAKDTFDVQQTVAGTLDWTEDESDTRAQPEAATKNRILAEIALNDERNSIWRLVKLDVRESSCDIQTRSDPGSREYCATFLAAANDIAMKVESKSLLLNHAEFSFPFGVSRALEMGDLDRGHFSALVTFPANTLTEWSDGTPTPSLFPNGDSAQRLVIASPASADGFGVNFIKQSFRNELIHTILSWTFLGVLVYILSPILSVLLFFLAIARDLIVDERVKPAVARFLRATGFLKPSETAAPS